MAAYRCPSMSEEAAYYLAGGPVWCREFSHGSVFGQPNRPRTSWRFGFPQAYPVSQLRFYGWGFLGVTTFGVSSAFFWRPRTEQFFHGGAVRNPIRFVHLSSDMVLDGTFLRDEVCVLGCDEEGRLWCYGAVVAPGRNEAVQQTISPGNSNALGLGRYTSDEGLRTGAQSRSMRNIATLVLGDQGDLSEVKFIKTQVVSHKSSSNYSIASSALSEDGDIWMAGEVSAYASADRFPLDSNAQLPFFRRVPVTSYIDRNMETVTQEEPLKFANYWHKDTILALTDDGRLFMTGLRSVIGSTSWKEMAGFVDTVNVVSGGSGYVNPSVTVDLPAAANGERTGVSVVVTDGVITSARITRPGFGYGDTAPQVTITDSTGTGAVIECTVHSGEWIYASVCNDSTHCAAIDSAGRLFTWGQFAINNTLAAPNFWNEFSRWNMPVLARNVTGRTFTRVEVGSLIRDGARTIFGVALTAEGEVCFWGNTIGTPTGVSRYEPTLLESVTEIGQQRFIDASAGYYSVMLLSEDGVAYGYGQNTCGQLGRQNSNSRLDIAAVEQGDAKWKRVFHSISNTLAIRDEEVDARGNRINPLPYEGPNV